MCVSQRGPCPLKEGRGRRGGSAGLDGCEKESLKGQGTGRRTPSCRAGGRRPVNAAVVACVRARARLGRGQDPDPDRERAERNKLRKRVRRELKGAVRELRRDGAFLEQQRAEQLRRQREARDARAKAIETFLAQQQFEAKLGSGKGRRRR